MNGRRLRRTRPRFCQHGQPSDNRISHELAELIDWSDPTDTTKTSEAASPLPYAYGRWLWSGNPTAPMGICRVN